MREAGISRGASGTRTSQVMPDLRLRKPRELRNGQTTQQFPTDFHAFLQRAPALLANQALLERAPESKKAAINFWQTVLAHYARKRRVIRMGESRAGTGVHEPRQTRQ